MDRKEVRLADLEDHVIICGWGKLGELVLRELSSIPEVWQKGVVVIAEVEDPIDQLFPIRLTGRLFHQKADFTRFDVLERCGAAKAKTAIVLADHATALRDQDRDARTVLAALSLEKINPNIFTCAEMLDEQNAAHLKIAGVEEIVSHAALAAGVMVSSAVNAGVSSTIQEVLSWGSSNSIQKRPVPVDLQGASFVEAFTRYKQEENATVIAVDQMNADGEVLHLVNPAADLTLTADDMLVVLAS